MLLLQLVWIKTQSRKTHQDGDRMNLYDYQALAMRTAKELPREKAILHMIVGLADELGELSSAIKQSEIYGNPTDFINISEEIGDLLWRVAYAAHVFGFSLETVARMNIEKLAIRYPDGYSDFHANARLDKTEES
jgi:NTP pyrophosphatase (non-canonical NTP hydrolase)